MVDFHLNLSLSYQLYLSSGSKYVHLPSHTIHEDYQVKKEMRDVTGDDEMRVKR